MLKQLLYISRSNLAAVPSTPEVEVTRILSTAYFFNQHLDVTGILMYGSDHFVQLLEGPQQGVAKVMARISKDRRHRHIQVLLDERVAARSVPGVAMRCAGLDEMASTAVEDALRALRHGRAEAAGQLLLRYLQEHARGGPVMSRELVHSATAPGEPWAGLQLA